MADDEEAPINGDVLEAILSRVALIDLVPASHVSIAWTSAVFSSLQHLNGLKPWLIVYRQSTKFPYATTAHGYDPRSHMWIEIRKPPINHHVSSTVLRSSHSNLLYTLSSTKLSFSFDPLHLTWHHADPRIMWRQDPIVAVVGNSIVIAGGGYEFEDDPLAIEIYDIDSREWDSCDSMPSVLRDYSASTWLSMASDDRKLFVTEKHSGVMHTFNPGTKSWCGPYDLRPDPGIFYSVIAFSDGRLVLVGLIGDMDNLEGLKLWGVNCESFACEEIGEMPVTLLEKLKSSGSWQRCLIGVCSAENAVHIYNPLTAEEVFMCEFVNGSCRWGCVPCVRNLVADGENCTDRLVFTSSKVGIYDVHKAMRSENWRFIPISYARDLHYPI